MNIIEHARTHPRDKPVEPESPLMLDGQIMPGDARLMIRCLLEELLMSAIPPDELRQMTRDANYQALYAARQMLGDQNLDELIDQTVARVGRHHIKTTESRVASQGATLTINAT